MRMPKLLRPHQPGTPLSLRSWPVKQRKPNWHPRRQRGALLCGQRLAWGWQMRKQRYQASTLLAIETVGSGTSNSNAMSPGLTPVVLPVVSVGCEALKANEASPALTLYARKMLTEGCEMAKAKATSPTLTAVVPPVVSVGSGRAKAKAASPASRKCATVTLGSGVRKAKAASRRLRNGFLP